MKAKRASDVNKKINENSMKKSRLLRFSSAVSFVPSPEETFSPNEFFKTRSKNGMLQFSEQTTGKHTVSKESFQGAISSILVVSEKVGGLMPIKLNKSSFSLFYILFLILSYTVMIMAIIYWLYKYQIEFGKIVPIIYYTTCLFTIICFYLLGKRWPIILEKFNYVEEKLLLQFKSQFVERKLAIKMRKISIIVLTFSLIQFFLLTSIRIYAAKDCPAMKDDISRAYFEIRFPYVFHAITYNELLGIASTFIQVVATFTWNYSDLFIILISLGVSSKLREYNAALQEDKGKIMMPSYWSEKRELYLDLCDLVLFVDESITLITMITLFKNLFFICIHLLNSFKDKESPLHSLYFWLCLIHITSRTLAIALYASDIYDETKKPLKIFRKMPRESWCHEIKRFIDDVTNDTIAFSGLKFFHITRGLVLNVAGTIITYELVLIQFRQTEEVTDYDPCQKYTNRSISS